MIFNPKIVKVNHPTNENRYWSSNLLENEGIKLFFLTKEAIQAYLACYGILMKREVAFQVDEALATFLSYDYSEEEIRFLTELLRHKNNEISNIGNLNEGTFKFLNELDPEGVKLLAVPKNINIPILKKLYRNAALKYHPDRGGSHDEMLQVNESFTLFYNALIN